MYIKDNLLRKVVLYTFDFYIFCYFLNDVLFCVSFDCNIY